MGQRSQVIIGYKTTEYDRSNHMPVAKDCRFARHLQWNYGAFMVIRAGQTIEFLNTVNANGDLSRDYQAKEYAQGALSMFCVNRITGNVQGLDESSDVSNCKASEWDNNNGLFITDLDPKNGYTFGFCTGYEEAAMVNGRKIKPMETIVSAREYLDASAWYLLQDDESIRAWADSMDYLRTDEHKKRWADDRIAEKDFLQGHLKSALKTLEQAEKEHSITAKRAKELMNMSSATTDLATV